MHRVILAALAAASFLAAPAFAQPPENLRLYSLLQNSPAFTIDGGKPMVLDVGVSVFTVQPGTHDFTLTDANGERTELKADLQDGNMTVTGGHAWWCLAAGRHPADNRLVLVFASQEQCMRLLHPGQSGAPAGGG